MEIYIVTNEGERYDSAYHDIIGVFDSLEKATTCARTCADDFVHLCDEGDDEGFDNYTIKTLYPHGIGIINDDNTNDYEAWYVDIYEVR